MNYTPGPWCQHGGLVLANHPDFPEVKGESLVVADCLNENLDPDAMCANARLIASAPDMLAALKAIKDACCDGKLTLASIPGGLQAIMLADAAIDKAEDKCAEPTPEEIRQREEQEWHDRSRIPMSPRLTDRHGEL